MLLIGEWIKLMRLPLFISFYMTHNTQQKKEKVCDEKLWWLELIQYRLAEPYHFFRCKMVHLQISKLGPISQVANWSKYSWNRICIRHSGSLLWNKRLLSNNQKVFGGQFDQFAMESPALDWSVLRAVRCDL
jgi:hypothetical protein